MKKELCSPYSELIKQLIKTFNIPTDCRKFVLTCEVDKLVEIETTTYALCKDENGESIENEVVETYNLVKKEDKRAKIVEISLPEEYET